MIYVEHSLYDCEWFTNQQGLLPSSDHLSETQRKEVQIVVYHVINLKIKDEEFTSLVEYIVLVGAHGRRPLLFIFSYFLLSCPAVPCPCPCPALFRIFLLLLGTGGGSYTGNGQCFFSFCCQGQEEEVTLGTGSVFFSFCCQGQEEEVTLGTGSVFFSFCCQGQEEEVTPCTAHPVLP
jgi:hypothetical protein